MKKVELINELGREREKLEKLKSLLIKYASDPYNNLDAVNGIIEDKVISQHRCESLKRKIDNYDQRFAVTEGIWLAILTLVITVYIIYKAVGND